MALAALIANKSEMFDHSRHCQISKKVLWIQLVEGLGDSGRKFASVQGEDDML
jgi:hypothetical protein